MSFNSSDKFYDALQEEPLDPPKEPPKDPPKLYTPLHIAARDGDLDKVNELLLYSNIDEVNNTENAYGMTPLHSAAQKGRRNVVKALLRHPDIDTKKKDKHGKTALELAEDYRHIGVVNAFNEDLADRKYKNKKKFKSLLASAKTHRDTKVGGRRKSRRATKSKRKRQTKRRRR